MTKRKKITHDFLAKRAHELRNSYGYTLKDVALEIGKTKKQAYELIKIGERISQ
jgi:hypothetical protein